MKICVLIPVYNEAKNIAQIVEALRAKNLDVLVVDDGSTDGSGDLAKAQGAHVIRHDEQNGKGYTLRKGFEYIMKQDFVGILAMDGDGQHDVGDIDGFLELAEKEPDSIINGNRMVDSKSMPLIRRWTNQFMSKLISLGCGQSIPDTQCGYRYIGCEVLRNINLSSSAFEIETEILMKASKKGYKIFDVPIKTIYRDEVSNINPFKDTIKFFIYFIKEIFSR